MEDYRVRMMQEHVDLAKKVSKLQAFIESNPIFIELDLLQRSRMRRQLEAMSLYLFILSERINLDRPRGTDKPLTSASSGAVLGNPARTAQKQDDRTSKWIAEWSQAEGLNFDKSNDGWDEQHVCEFVAWLLKTNLLTVTDDVRPPYRPTGHSDDSI